MWLPSLSSLGSYDRKLTSPVGIPAVRSSIIP
jgi:hypothetical protein